MTSKSKSNRYKIDWQTDHLKISNYQFGTIKSRCRLTFLVIELEFLGKKAKADLQQEYFSVECIPYLFDLDLDLDAMTLALNLDLDIVKVYICILEMKFLALAVQKLQTEQIHTHTGYTDRQT